MAGKYLRTAKKLQTACKKQFGVRLLINERQWYSEQKDMAVTVYSIVESRPNNEGKRNINVELFQTYSQVQLVLFMRDYWYTLNGWEVPHDNERWEEIKAKYGKSKVPSGEAPECQSARDGRYTLDSYGTGIFD